ncbi:MAG: hypothetical protein KKA76_13390, partial [Proteobacteria bacterium]|nr:hypothetical protein [Pseudomonadota bacterium]
FCKTTEEKAEKINSDCFCQKLVRLPDERVPVSRHQHPRKASATLCHRETSEETPPLADGHL